MNKPPGEHRGRDSGANRGGRDDSGMPRVVTSENLLAGRSQLAILHNETLYFLRHTRFGKLILTK